MATGLTDTLIPLHHGPVVPASIVSWLIDAEFRGLRFRPAPDGQLRVGPPAVVTPEDLAFIRRHRDVLRACVVYVDRMCEAPL